MQSRIHVYPQKKTIYVNQIDSTRFIKSEEVFKKTKFLFTFQLNYSKKVREFDEIVKMNH